MTKNEKAGLLHLIDHSKEVRASGRSYEWGEGTLVCTGEGDGPEKLDSKDYKLGWKRCAEYVELILTEVFLRGDNGAIKKWVGSSRLKELLKKT